MRQIRRSVLPLIALAAAGCASAGAASSGSAVNDRTVRWTANLKQPQMASSAVISADVSRAQAASYGSALLTPLLAGDRTKVELNVTAPNLRGSQVAWAVFPGACSAAAPPVIAATEFPLIDVSNNGTGVVRTEMAFALTPRSAYHVKVYGSSRVTDLSNVVMCGPLAYNGPR
jgi:hypothetical protein